jgi:hypothetical protein
MQARFTHWSLAVALSAAVAGCSSNSGAPTAPTGNAGGSTTAAADGTTLKATAPSGLSPADRATVDSLRPTLRFQAGRGKFADNALTHRIELYIENTLILSHDVGASTGVIEFAIPDTVEMTHARVYRWRARAQSGSSFGPWSGTVDFITPNPPAAAPGGSGSGGGVGVSGQRDIGINEALNIIVNVHNSLGYNLGSGSSREQRIDFLWTAVAVIHFGHPRFNPAGGDPGWCVKDAGGGRPPSDDVLVRCGSRDAWDLIGGAGANGYSWHLDYLGRLGGEQNVYPPPAGHLPR